VSNQLDESLTVREYLLLTVLALLALRIFM